MLPKNSDLFSDLSEIERLFIDPEKYPWEAINDMIEFMVSCAGIRTPESVGQKTRDWPENLPNYHESVCAPKSPSRFLSIDRPIHVRGGLGLKTDQSVYIHGPVILGSNVKLRKGAMIIGPAYIGDDVVIGHNCLVRSAIVLSGVRIEFSTRVSYGFLGRKVYIGANTVASDCSIDCNRISLLTEKNDLMQTGMMHLGLIAGDKCKIGGGSIFVPGVILSAGSRVMPGTRILRSGVVDKTMIDDAGPLIG